eukprot:TRINITY_DN2167_c3_g1_i1.p1 TRINITY_DN2167_c3_g1~~TRINITY_DN2167_c3_g1_i1.p1  ORF type:complete len:154 (+),score=71.20 TRINITY_DN2167_c3_g1_i1:118-579(+)
MDNNNNNNNEEIIEGQGFQPTPADPSLRYEIPEVLPLSTDQKPNESLIVNDKNATKIRCRLCSCLMVLSDVSKLVELQQFVHCSKQQQGADKGETLNWFWEIADMFKFENIGFSKTLGSLRYLTCADCEKEIVGFQNLPNPICYLAANRVKYD